jgi:hypothetical protein
VVDQLGGRRLSGWAVSILLLILFVEGSAGRYHKKRVGKKISLQEVTFDIFYVILPVY